MAFDPLNASPEQIADYEAYLARHGLLREPVKLYRLAECRYCERYGRACGRDHSEASRPDWGRDWRGNPR